MCIGCLLRVARSLAPLLLSVSFLTACDGGDDDGSSGSPVNTGGWISIEIPTSSSTYSLDSNSRDILLKGDAFMGSYYCNASSCGTSMGITWENLSTGQNGGGSASVEVCWLLQYYPCGILWSANPQLVIGENIIQVTATDDDGDYGTRQIVITLSDSMAPAVVVMSPNDLAIDAPLDTSVMAAFSENINPASITNNALVLNDPDGNRINGIITSSADSIAFTPDTPLANSTSYTVTVSAGLMDEIGNTLSQTQWTFTTSDRTWVDTSVNAQPRYKHTAVWSGSKMILWGGYFTTDPLSLSSGTVYDPSSDTSFLMTPTGAPESRGDHTAVWTGTEMIVWGGIRAHTLFPLVQNWLNTGGRFNPELNAWSATAMLNAPAARSNHTAVWTGSEMIVWGGRDENGTKLATGARYNPITDTWGFVSNINAPTARTQHSAIWTGTEMIVWGGTDASGAVADGARYNPANDTWIAMTNINAPAPRYDHAAVWAGTEMLVWGSGDIATVTGGRYDPVSDSWAETSVLNAPEPRADFTSVWTGKELVVWGGRSRERVLISSVPFPQSKWVTSYLDSIGIYSPDTDSWRTFPMQNTPLARYGHSAIWTGRVMGIWGGLSSTGLTNTGGMLTVN